MKGCDLTSPNSVVACSRVGRDEPTQVLVLPKEAFRVLPGTPTPMQAEGIKETSP